MSWIRAVAVAVVPACVMIGATGCGQFRATASGTASTNELSARVARALAAKTGANHPNQAENVVISGAHALGLTATIAGVHRVDTQLVAVQLDVNVALDGEAVPSLSAGSIGLDTTEDSATQTAIDEWVTQYGLPISAAVWPTGLAEKAISLFTFQVGKFNVVAGPPGTRGDAPAAWEAAGPTASFQTELFDLLEPQFDSIFPNRAPCRRLRFLNALALALAKHDCSLSLNGHEGREGSAHIGNQHVSFKLDFTGPLYGKERLYSNRAQEKGPYKLRMQMEKDWTKGPPITWEDKDDAPLENQITEIVVSLIVAGEQQMRDGIAWHKEADRQYAIHLEEQKKAEEEAAEKERFEALLAGAAAWKQACDIRDFVAAMRGNGDTEDVTVGGKPLDEWCAWALSQADKIDPTISQ